MLEKYREKRDFEKTSEPSPEDVALAGERLRFCVQRHSARNLHYDLRLEFDGVLKSWAVPKGPSLDPKDRHLAVMVEDHPLSYATFEGSIPKGEYGGGEIIVWDEGTYAPIVKDVVIEDRVAAEKAMRTGIEKGKFDIRLDGHKLRGKFILTRSRDTKNWLLIKGHGEGESTEDVLLNERSVLTRRTNEDIRLGREATEVKPPAKAVERPMPRTFIPMAPTETPKVRTGENWSYELKLDGIRVTVFMERGKARLVTRTGNNVTAKFGTLVRELEGLAPHNCLLDGEIVMFDETGRPTFQGLMQRFSVQDTREIARLDTSSPVVLMLFDVMYLDKFDLKPCPFTARREVLEELKLNAAHIKTVDVFPGEGELLYEHARKLGLEGVVGKKVDSVYIEGKSESWIKIKGSHSEEFMILGFVKGQGNRSKTFGSLILGRQVEGEWVYCGNVGTGFSDDLLDSIQARLDLLRSDEALFKGSVGVRQGKPIWVKPELIAEVKFLEWTKDGHLRGPAFLRLRDDLAPLKVTMKEPAAEASQGSTEVEDILKVLDGNADAVKLIVGGNVVGFTSLSKELWPKTDEFPVATKRDLLRYLTRMAKPFLDALRDRPVAMVRYPHGIDGEGFFQKHVEKGLPDFVETVELFSTHNDKTSPYILVNNLATLLWAGQNSALEIHPWYSRVNPRPDAEELPTDFLTDEALDDSVLSYPDFMVVDLDPNIRSGKEKEGAEPELNRQAWEMVVPVALQTRIMLRDVGLKSYIKTSGKTGLHLYVPIIRDYDYDIVRKVAETFGRHLLKKMPAELTMEWSVKKRPQKIFWDHNQNVRGKTLISAYGPRAVPGAPVSMPIEWDEVDNIYPSDFTIFNAPDRYAAKGDLWADILTVRQKLIG